VNISSGTRERIPRPDRLNVRFAINILSASPSLNDNVNRSDTLKRHERLLHEKDDGPPLKRKAINTMPSIERVSSCPPGEPSLDSATAPLPGNPVDQYINSGPQADQVFAGNVLPFSDLPRLNTSGPGLTPLSGTDFPMIFDIDINALNEFLTSGDFNALYLSNQENALATPVSEVLTTFPRSFPQPSEAVKPAWFTNMEEKDLENEAVILRTSYPESSQSVQSPKLDETRNIDEAWRGNLSTSLAPKVFNPGPLPSSEFLVHPRCK
jgi:hypothetical protein